MCLQTGNIIKCDLIFGAHLVRLQVPHGMKELGKTQRLEARVHLQIKTTLKRTIDNLKDDGAEKEKMKYTYEIPNPPLANLTSPTDISESFVGS